MTTLQEMLLAATIVFGISAAGFGMLYYRLKRDATDVFVITVMSLLIVLYAGLCLAMGVK